MNIPTPPPVNYPPIPVQQKPPQNIPTPQPINQEVQLKSSCGMDYRQLRELLTQGKWKEADAETARVMLAVAKREKEGDLDVNSIDNFPCEDLRTIDQLWVKYSNGKFGFSVQKRIYQGLGGTRNHDQKIWQAWADKVVWKTERSWLYSKRFYPIMNFTYDIKAPEGHLPTPRVYQHIWASTMWYEEVAKGLTLFSRVETCKF
jgi:hypothetical protein